MLGRAVAFPAFCLLEGCAGEREFSRNLRAKLVRLAFMGMGVYTGNCLSRSRTSVGESPLFCWAQAGTQITGRSVGWQVRSGGSGKLEMDLERIREAAERVARSLGLEVVDVEWKVGKDRFLRVYIDKPGRRQPQRLRSAQQSVQRDPRRGGSGAGAALYSGGQFAGPGPQTDQARGVRAIRRGGWRASPPTEPVENQKFFEGRLAGVADGKVQIEVKGRVIRAADGRNPQSEPGGRVLKRILKQVLKMD